MALRLALLGCGPLGTTYAALAAATGSTVLVVFDGDHDVAVATAQQTGARIAPTLNDAVTAVGVDAVVVCLGGSKRLEAITAAAGARRAVFDALPPSRDAVPALDTVQAAGVPFGVDLRRRHDTGIRESVDAVRNGEIGTVRSCSVVSRDDTMSSEQSLIHDLDLARHATGSEIVDVVGIETPDNTMLLLTHASGAITSIENSQDAPLGVEFRIEVTGTLGTAASTSRAQTGASIATAEGERRRSRTDDVVVRSLTAQWAAFVTAATSGIGSQPDTTITTDINAALRAARAAGMALAEGRTVGVAELTSDP